MNMRHSAGPHGITMRLWRFAESGGVAGPSAGRRFAYTIDSTGVRSNVHIADHNECASVCVCVGVVNVCAYRTHAHTRRTHTPRARNAHALMFN